jgi:hypothetical protein
MFIVVLKLVVRIQCGKKVTRLKWNKNSDTHSNAFISNFPHYDPRNRIRLLQRAYGLCKPLLRLVFSQRVQLGHSVKLRSTVFHCAVKLFALSTIVSNGRAFNLNSVVWRSQARLYARDNSALRVNFWTGNSPHLSLLEQAHSHEKHIRLQIWLQASWLLPIDVSVLLASAYYCRPSCAACTLKRT